MKHGGGERRRQGKRGESAVFDELNGNPDKKIPPHPATIMVVRSASSRPVDLLWFRNEYPKVIIIEVKAWRMEKRAYMRKADGDEIKRLVEIDASLNYGEISPVGTMLVTVRAETIDFYWASRVTLHSRLSMAGAVKYPWDLEPWLSLPARSRSSGGKGEGGDKHVAN